ncbi:MAG TPA: DUF4333 domain-containing protein [Pseudonocardia sp.]|jgi:hypothetical protein|nr:DUF4333 domain-containing protein [Pseudonocardia sp.]
MNARIGRTIGTPAVAGGLLLGLSACSSVVTGDDVKAQITSTVQEQLGTSANSVDCPDDLEAEVGASVQRNVVMPDRTFDVVAEVTSVEGRNVKFDINQV